MVGLKFAIIFFLFFNLLCCNGSGEGEEEGTCQDQEDCSSTHKESLLGEKSQWLRYLKQVNASLETYSDCGERDDSSGCGCHTPTLKADLETWVQRGGIQWEEFEAAKTPDAYGLVHYQIINHTLFRQKDCMFMFRCSGVEHFLLQLLPTLPDMELLINVRDYPFSLKRKTPLPIFSFSKTSSYYDIMYPAWSFWSGGPSISFEPSGLGRWDLKRKSLRASSEEWPWERKRDLGFFRGSRTSSERDPLILLSREQPELVDAQYTKNQAWKSDKDTLGTPPAGEVSLEDHCQYKYLFNFRGVAASFRLRHLFLCKSVVLHVGEEWEEFFYPSLRPWVHYVPLQSNLSDLRDVLEFLKTHNQIAQEIAERGFWHIWDHLDIEDVLCYWRELLVSYSQLCHWTVTKQESFSTL